MQIELIIFDCDGILVDSETLGTGILVEMMGELGVSYPLERAVPLFRGVKMAECVRLIEDLLGASVPDSFVADFRARCIPAFEARLRPIDGIEHLLQRLLVPYCVASSSPVAKIRHMLRKTGLLERFEDKIFSADDVQSWKPDPDLFLYAAKQMGVLPEACAVVEDSLVGVQAGIAAGMMTFGYADATYENALAEQGARVFRHMSELGHMLSETNVVASAQPLTSVAPPRGAIRTV